MAAIKGSLESWAEFVAEKAGVHGVNWFAHFTPPSLRSVTLLLILAFIPAMPLFVWSFSRDYLSKNSVKFRNDIVSDAKSVLFPAVTVCHPFVFDWKRLESKWIHLCIHGHLRP